MQDQSQYQALKQEVTSQVTASLTKKATKNVEAKQLPKIKKQVTSEAKLQLVQTLREKLE